MTDKIFLSHELTTQNHFFIHMSAHQPWHFYSFDGNWFHIGWLVCKWQNYETIFCIESFWQSILQAFTRCREHSNFERDSKRERTSETKLKAICWTAHIELQHYAKHFERCFLYSSKKRLPCHCILTKSSSEAINKTVHIGKQVNQTDGTE